MKSPVTEGEGARYFWRRVVKSSAVDERRRVRGAEDRIEGPGGPIGRDAREGGGDRDGTVAAQQHPRAQDGVVEVG